MLYTCTECKNDVPFIYQGAICRTCYQQAGYTLNLGEWEREMNYSHPNPSRAWND